MANVIYWFHQAATIDSNGWPIPVVAEPSLRATPGSADVGETLTTPDVTTEAPPASEFLTIETDVKVRYTLRQAGDTASVATALCKSLDTPGGQVAIRPGQSIHFIDG